MLSFERGLVLGLSAEHLFLSLGRTESLQRVPVTVTAITGGALLAAVDSMALFGPQALLGTPAQLSFLPTRIYEALKLSLKVIESSGKCT